MGSLKVETRGYTGLFTFIGKQVTIFNCLLVKLGVGGEHKAIRKHYVVLLKLM